MRMPVRDEVRPPLGVMMRDLLAQQEARLLPGYQRTPRDASHAVAALTQSKSAYQGICETRCGRTSLTSREFWPI